MWLRIADPYMQSTVLNDPNPGVLSCHQPGVHSLQCHFTSQVRSFSQLSLSFLSSAGVVCGKFGGNPQKLVK